MSKSLVLTLGHNASAIVVRDGQILGGYEEERFSKIKSDSSFPRKSIDRLIHYFGASFDDICIGHWFTNGILSNNKYIDMDYLNALSGQINSISEGLTHHDTHLLSAQVFAKHYGMPAEHTAIVADGFGTYGECISVYDCTTLGYILRSRYFGYGKSLGMLYQYATAYLEMKMHNHEYKMLGYEAHIHEVADAATLSRLNEIIALDSRAWVKSMYNDFVEKDTDPIVNKAALAATQESIANRLDGVLEQLERTDCSLADKRVLISYYVQGIVEAVMAAIVELERPKNLLVAGGLFYNVKLNHKLSNMVEKFCAMPLAGDQGAGLGVYHGVHGDLTWPGHVAWGHRDLYNIGKDIPRIFEVDAGEAVSIAMEQLQKNKMVNIVRGSMEFGPRSLCNTATIAIPDMATVERINAMNDRTSIMPMAPAMTRAQANEYLVDCDKIVGSLDYMIVTRDVKPEKVELITGASHAYPIEDRATCRPQIVDDNDLVMTTLLNEFGPLINTSFNYHGVPIVFDKETIEYSHTKQNESDFIVTVVIK